MKKILILANDTTYTYNLRDVLLRTFIAEGFDVIIACERLKYFNELLDLGVRLIDLKINRHSKNPFSDFFLYAHFRKIIKQEKPSVVLTYNIKPNVYGGMACKSTRVPYIPNITGLGTAVENPGIVQKIATTLYKIGISKAACVMFQNRENKQYFIEKGLLSNNSNTCLLPGSGVNLERFTYQPYPSSESPIIFSIIGRIMKDKGTDELLEAAKVVKKTNPDVRFKMVGYFDEDYQSAINKAVKEGLVEYVEEQEDIRPFMKDSWAIIQPSHHEGMSNVLLESLATGRPVIATDIPGCRETFDNNISGFAFPVRDSKMLSEMIIRFIKLPYKEKCEMGRAGRSKMEREFDRNIVAQAYLTEIRKTEVRK